MIKKLVLGVVIGALIYPLFIRPIAAVNAVGWSNIAFQNSTISLVKVNRWRPNEVAAVANGSLQLTRDGGITWRSSAVPSLTRQIEYDPVVSDRLYPGTDAGVYISDNAGVSWRLFDSGLSARKITQALVATSQYLFAAMYDGAGTPQQLFRFGLDGSVAILTPPDGGSAWLEYDFERHRLYDAAANGVYSSEDYGVSWRFLGGGRSAESIVAKGKTLWEGSADGLFRSQDDGANWVRLARAGELNGTYYGSDLRISGLAVNNNRAFYGTWSIGFPYRFLGEYSGTLAHSELDARVYSVASGGNRVWAATGAGLWVNDQVATSEVHIQRPVIVVPGVLGSMPVPNALLRQFVGYLPEPTGASYHTSLVLDPIQHTYDGLISGLRAAGYQTGTTLFSFPYEWRHDNQQSGRELAVRIADVLRVCSCAQVDIIAHSMGGLVARSYIESAAYAGDVHALVQIATPNAGSPSAYAAWEAGSINDNHSLQDHLANLVFKIEAAHAGSGSLAQYIRQSVPSAGQLLPISSYLSGRTYPSGYPRNSFLEQLNATAGVQQLKQRVAYFLVGSTSQSTLANLSVTASRPLATEWPDGEIIGKTNGSGDGTVPIDSTQAITPVSRMVAGNHGDIVGAADTLSYIKNTLLGDYLGSNVANVPTFTKYLAIYVHSPVKLQITNAIGLRLNDQVSEILGAYYTGSEAATQFALIPNPSGDYTVILSGLGFGNFGVGAQIINLETGGSRTSFISSTISIDQQKHFLYETTKAALVGTDPPQPSGPVLATNIVQNPGLVKPAPDLARYAYRGELLNRIKRTTSGRLKAESKSARRKQTSRLALLIVVISATSLVAIVGIFRLLRRRKVD